MDACPNQACKRLTQSLLHKETLHGNTCLFLSSIVPETILALATRVCSPLLIGVEAMVLLNLWSLKVQPSKVNSTLMF